MLTLDECNKLLAELAAEEKAVQEQYTRLMVQKGRYDKHCEMIAEQQQHLQHRSMDLEQVIQDLNVVMQAEQIAKESFKSAIEAASTEALQFIFGPEYRCLFEFRQASNAVPSLLILIGREQGGTIHYENPEKMRGGGVRRVLATVLQLEFLKLWPTKLDCPIFFDECLGEVDRNHRERFLLYIKQAAVALNRPILLITHTEEGMDIADRIYEVQHGKVALVSPTSE